MNNKYAEYLDRLWIEAKDRGFDHIKIDIDYATDLLLFLYRQERLIDELESKMPTIDASKFTTYNDQEY